MRQGERTDLEPSAELRKVDQSSAAKMLNVSERSVQNAALIRSTAEPELRHVIEQGHVTVDLGAKAAKLEPGLQREAAVLAMKGELNVVRKVVKKALRERHEAELGAKIKALPTKKYDVIVADPPWAMEFWGEGANTVADHYATAPLDEIKNMAEDDLLHRRPRVCPVLVDDRTDAPTGAGGDDSVGLRLQDAVLLDQRQNRTGLLVPQQARASARLAREVRL